MRASFPTILRVMFAFLTAVIGSSCPRCATFTCGGHIQRSAPSVRKKSCDCWYIGRSDMIL
ncbi:hypothetical protein HBI56_014990 [Parastagonospora nodorum]|uniref:Secreted protein n=1 Tax=Phaeosphaeria nodorum (strain SN15 / ATCC MYA-4574 / FGSC 10173) TaxID=321614 RepID=A0A7U2F1G0_PHANO|nr:hypothetical protein HBH56_084990 [Parastagonospora nodorum]QRC96857.1 hypothetical protein JI435_409700 [Parastagonospora nodorum SN15]KAH3929981.1 hypothetical protein HBH54_116850 [Parastagonospora nodorum]KAH4040785.1 hypothetical protein HBI09_013840 [Parastagonospora nodorum]KAH4058659.1 hypothetical protein HBH49_036040 [Parastagonospora nodorum]